MFDTSSLYTTYNTTVIVQALMNISRIISSVQTEFVFRMTVDPLEVPKLHVHASIPRACDVSMMKAVLVWDVVLMVSRIVRSLWWYHWTNWLQPYEWLFPFADKSFPQIFERYKQSSIEVRSFLRRQEWNIPPMPRWKWQAQKKQETYFS